MPPESLRKSVSDIITLMLGEHIPEANEPSDSEDDDIHGMTTDDLKNSTSCQKIMAAYELKLQQAERLALEANESFVQALTVQTGFLELALERKTRRLRALHDKMIKDGGFRVRLEKRNGVLNARLKNNVHLIVQKAEEKEARAEADELVELADRHNQECNNRLRVAKAKLTLVDQLAKANGGLKRERSDGFGLPRKIKVRRVKVASAKAKRGQL
ncbi:hypothetical protein EWM64_g335 [Hericium alpestre]|uniref:Uncharacterized protein n=1 Tax=Hericium alpestre TaxID=135208 RepID=A0A4Z0AAC8_9AGAM|nr:hypothetical protein EWM64_g335 [Hericium alpestre]